jgi:predicted NUDIX family NTP pyrophosphohydrolase
LKLLFNFIKIIFIMAIRKLSAGILLYRRQNKRLEVLLAHPGGPYWAKKDDGAWSIPKGEFSEGEEPLDNAVREFEEETGKKVSGDFMDLGWLKQRSGKIVYAYALEGDLDTSQITSNLFEIEWPPRSGKMIMIPEVDRVEWFSPETAREKINPGQAAFIDRLIERLNL